ncbi:7174_t:CDS:2 [Entrophospora sp. SA101]|nr:7174_t:CDS:2 [Entrophospora sp. SA101]
MSTDTQLFSPALDKIRLYFDAELPLQVTIEDLANWLKTQSVCITTHKLQNILQEHSGEFSLTKSSENNQTIVKLKKIVNPQEPQHNYIDSNARSLSIISGDLIDFSNNNVDKIIKNNSFYVSENSLILSNNGEQISQNHFNDNLYKQQRQQPPPPPPPPSLHQEQQQWRQLQNQPNSKINQINNDNDETVKALKNYLDKFLIDSIHEVERYLKRSGVLKDGEINEILFEDQDIFHVHKVKGVTCVKLRNPAKIIDEHSLTMINNRIEQTESLIKEYIKKNYSENGVTSTELLIYLRGVKGTISYEFKEFLKNCSNSFNCYENDGILFVENKPGSYSQLPISNSKQLIYSHGKDLNIKEISGEIYICLKPTDHNILCHVRRYLLEYGRVQLSLIGDYLKRLDFSPKLRLKEFLSSSPDYVFNSESTSAFIKSKEIEIVRSIRELFKNDKRMVALSVVSDYLNKSINYPRSKVMSLLENYTEFDFYQDSKGIMVVHRLSRFDPKPKELIRKLIIYGNGKVKLSTLNAHLNWNGNYSEYKLLDFIKKSDEFQQINNYYRGKHKVPKVTASIVNNEFSSNLVGNYNNNNNNMIAAENLELANFNKSKFHQPKDWLETNEFNINQSRAEPSESLRSYNPSSSDKIISRVDSNDAKEVLREFLINQEKQLFSSFKTIESWKDYSETNLKRHQVEIKTRDEEIKRCHQEIEGLNKIIAKLQMENDNLRHYDMTGFYN